MIHESTYGHLFDHYNLSFLFAENPSTRHFLRDVGVRPFMTAVNGGRVVLILWGGVCRCQRAAGQTSAMRAMRSHSTAVMRRWSWKSAIASSRTPLVRFSWPQDSLNPSCMSLGCLHQMPHRRRPSIGAPMPGLTNSPPQPGMHTPLSRTRRTMV